MGKHRHKQHYRRTVVAAVAIGVIGVPSVAMACAEWPDGGGRQSRDSTPVAASAWWNDPDWYRRWSGGDEPAASAPSQTPAASATAAGQDAGAAGKKAIAKKKRHPHHGTAASPWAPHTPSGTATGTSGGASTPGTTAPAAPPTTSAPTPSAPASAPASPSAPKDTATASGPVAQVVRLVNAERAKAGCPALTVNATLTKSAQAHSEDMAAHGDMSHTGSDGSSPADRITAAGYSWSAYGENVAYGYSTPEEVMAGWMASPGHRENILNCSFKEIGVGLAQPNAYWTQDFGTPR